MNFIITDMFINHNTFRCMKIRTTLSDLNRSSMAPFEPLTLFELSYKGCFFAPHPDDDIARYRQELPSNKYNGLSLSDMDVFARLKGMDRLHKADAVASLYKRSFNVKSHLGKSDFLNHYSK